MIGVVVAFDDAHPAVFQNQQVIGHLIDEIAVVADEEHGAVEGGQGPLQGIAGPKIEVVGGLVEHQEVGLCGSQPGQGHAAALAPAEAGHRLQLTVAAQSESRQQVAPLLLVELLAGRADGVHGRLLLVELGQLLVEVARHDALAEADRPASGCSRPKRHRSSVVLPQPFGPRTAQRWPRSDLKVDAGKERLLIGLGELHGSDHDVAGAGSRGKAHRRGTDFPRRRHQLDPLQFLAAVFRLGVLLSVMMAADELLGLGDLDLLLFIGPLLDQQPLGLLLPIGGEIAGVTVDRAAEQAPACDWSRGRGSSDRG